MDKYIGRLLDNRYEILEVIGTGGMAVVYKARCHRLNRFVAIKILKAEFSKDADFRRRFQAESQAVAMLSHANIVNVYDVSRGGDVDYIVMELIDGMTLKQYMQQKGRLNWREALHFATQIAKALEHAHSRGVIHRDIKPHNIMVLKDGSVKVADFGIAHFASSAQNTLTREALGSVHYISPEQARGARVDNRSDIYSLGVVMYEMLTGKPPYDGDSAVAVAIQHINSSPVPIRQINPDVPEGLAQITMHSMSSNLIGRYSNATELLEDLEEFRKNPQVRFRFGGPAVVKTQQQQPAKLVQPTRNPQKPPQPEDEEESSRWPLIAGISFLLVALVGIGFFLYRYLLADLFSGAEELTVPSFVGEYYDAIDPNDYPDFVIVRGEDQYDDEVAAGYVISQTPMAGKTAKAGTEITLIVSLGEETAEMPYLINHAQTEAEQTLRALNLDLQITIELRENNDYTAGQVIETVPSYGATLRRGDSVTLVVAENYTEDDVLIRVPSFVGLTEEAAQQRADEAGLTVSIERVASDELAEGYVIFQSIEAETEVREGTQINLHVSDGPAEEESDTTEEPEPSDSEEPEDTEEPESSGTVEETPSEEPEETSPEVSEEQTPAGTSAYTSVETTVTLPAGEGVTEMVLKLNGVQYGEASLQELSPDGATTVPVILWGSGTMTLDVYLDGELWETQTVEFE